MKPEIEVKFLNVDHDEIRTKLKALGAKLEHPMRLMHRQMFDYADNRLQNNHERLRVRDEGDGKVCLNYKSRAKSQYADEIEVVVSSLEETSAILKAIGLKNYSNQESKRETWTYKNVEVVLDEWPWINPFIEIEGPTEEVIQQVAKELGFNWQDGKFGSADTIYMIEYPKMKKDESIGDLEQIKFGMPLPQWLKDRQ